MDKVSRVGGVSSPEVLKVFEWFKSQLGGGFQVVDFWANEDKTQWYRKWSNGFIECGGRYDNASVVHDFATTITFPITFTELPFILCTAARGTNLIWPLRAVLVHSQQLPRTCKCGMQAEVPDTCIGTPVATDSFALFGGLFNSRV